MIQLDDLTIPQGAFTLTDVSITVPAGAYAVLMGKTGCGKTTLLEAVAGLRTIATGRVILADLDVTSLPPAARNVGYVPQDAVLFKTMTVWDNLAFGLMVRKLPRNVIQERVRELAGRLGLTNLLPRLALGLSGGEAQRVALGRALAARPPVLLLDEPLSALDEETREQLVNLLKWVHSDSNVTVLHVTHSRQEAELLGDLVLRLEDGKIREPA